MTALKTTSLRLRGTSVDVLEEEGVDSEGAVESKSKLQSKVLALSGVNILTDAGAYKSTYQILSEIAKVWEDIDNMEQAALLELLAGKRNASVLAAILQAPEQLEAAYADAQDAEGSALRENEKYLDSIQGRIDLFTNSVQTMWSNTLGSDFVKWIVNLGTELVKFIDKIGLLPSILGGVFIYFTAFKKQNPIDIIKDLGNSLMTAGLQAKQYGTSLSTLTVQQQAAKMATSGLTQAEIASQLVSQNGIEQDKAKALAEEAVTAAKIKQSGVTAQQVLAAWAENKVSISAQAADWLEKQSTDALTRAKLLEAVASGAITKQDYLEIAAKYGLLSATESLKLGVKGLTATIQASMASNPIGWILMAVSVVISLVMWLSTLKSTTEKLTEELNDLKMELQDIQSEIETVNSELETTNDRIAELLAKDSLSFVEQEELDRLKKENDELQRHLDLLELQEKNKTEDAANKFVEKMDKDSKTGYSMIYESTAYEGHMTEDVKWIGSNPWTSFWKGLFGGGEKSFTGSEYVDTLLAKYQDYQVQLEDIEKQIITAGGEGTQEGDKLAKRKKVIDENMTEIKSYMDGKISEWNTDAEGLDYGINDETDEWLDYVHNMEDRWAIEQGGKNAAANAINRIFDKDENAEISDSIDEYVEALRKGDKSAKEKIDSIIRNNEDLVADLQASGITINNELNEAADYFTSFASELEFATIEGKVKDITLGSEAMTKVLNGLKDGSVDINSLFDEEGKVIQTALSEMFQGTSDQTREDATRMLENAYQGIADGLDDTEIEALLGKFGLKLSASLLDVKKTLQADSNFELFPNLEEEINGIIDTFDELSSAVNSIVDSMDLLEKARAEEAHSGSISLETMMQLMEYTDDYAKIMEIDEYGAIKLVAGAEEILVEEKLARIKTDAELALQSAEVAYQDALTAEQEAIHAEQTVNVSSPAQEWYRDRLGDLASMTAYVGSLWDSITSGNIDGMFDRAKSAADQAKLDKAAGYEEERAKVSAAVEAAQASVADKKKARDEAQDRNDWVQALTPENLKTKTKSDDVIQSDWEKLLAKYENQLALITNERDLIEAEIDRMEAQGGKASTQYYDDLIRSSAEEKALLEQKKAAMEEYLAANADNIDQDTWIEYNNEINETAVAIKECEVNTIEWAEAVREIDLHYFEQITDEVSHLGEELDFVNSLLEDEEVSDENGNWSSAVLTRMGLYTQQMEKAATEAAMYQDEIDKVNDQYEAGALSEEQYQEKLSDLVSGQQDAIQSYEDAKDSIVEMNEARIDAIKEGIEKEIEAYEDLIDAKKEELDAERELHDFRENIKNQTKDIASLERRIAALSGSSAASDVAERRKLEEQLQQAKEGLNDTYYDHSRDAQSAALDAEAEAYTQSKERYIEQLEEQLENTELLIQNSIMDVMLNADTVYTELNELADLYGIDLSDSLTLPWKNASAQAIQWKNELQTSMTSGEYAALIGEGGAITAFANGVATKLKGSWTSAQTAAKNYAGYLTGEELKNRFANTLTGFGSQIQTIIDKWNGVRKAADDAYAAQTRKVTVGGTGSGNIGSGNDNYTPTPTNYTPKPTPTPTPKPTVKLRGLMQTSEEKILGSKSFVDENTETINGVKYYMDSNTGYYYKISDLNSKRKYDGGRTTGWAIPKGTWFYTKYAKGTTGTTRDEWAITDEPQFGDELTMYATPEGTLSFMRAGSTVIPADLTRELIDLPKVVDGLINRPKFDSGINMIANAINKPEIVIDMENFLKVDRVDKDTLPQLEAMMDKKIDAFAKQLNYSIKKFAR